MSLSIMSASRVTAASGCSRGIELASPPGMWCRVGLLAICLAACGGADNRPATFDFITLTVLRPSCGLAACHASVTNTAGFTFDTLEGARDALSVLVIPGDPDASELTHVIRDERSMPPDSPMLDGDIALIEQWIAEGAPGLQ